MNGVVLLALITFVVVVWCWCYGELLFCFDVDCCTCSNNKRDVIGNQRTHIRCDDCSNAVRVPLSLASRRFSYDLGRKVTLKTECVVPLAALRLRCQFFRWSEIWDDTGKGVPRQQDTQQQGRDTVTTKRTELHCSTYVTHSISSSTVLPEVWSVERWTRKYRES